MEVSDGLCSRVPVRLKGSGRRTYGTLCETLMVMSTNKTPVSTLSPVEPLLRVSGLDGEVGQGML